MKPDNPLDDLNEIETTKEKLGKGYIVALILVGLLLLIAGFYIFYGINTVNHPEAENTVALDSLMNTFPAIQPQPDTTYVDTVH